MADAQASGACYGNIVWVQVPSPASLITKSGMRGSVGTGRRARLRILWWVHRVGSSPIFRSLIGNRNVPDFFCASVPSREAAQGLVGMADCFILFAMHKLSLYGLNIKEKAAAYATFVEPTGLEPMTSRTSSGRSSQLSYGSIFCSSSDKDSGTDGARTRDLSRVRRTLIPAELRFHDPVRFSLTSPSEYLCILLHCL